MIHRSELRERFLRDPLSVQLGGLAANLSRVRSFSDNPAHGAIVATLLQETGWFIEWAAADTPLETQLQLVECQRDLARWRRTWSELWADPGRRSEMAERAGQWSQKILQSSVLLESAPQASGRHGA